MLLLVRNIPQHQFVTKYTHISYDHMYSLSPDKWVWSRLKVKGVPSPSLAAHSCAVLDSRLYLFGGLTPEGSASHQLYCLHTGKVQLHVHDIIHLYTCTVYESWCNGTLAWLIRLGKQ